MAPSSIFEIPRPKTFLHSMSLRTGAEIITFLQLINKVSGVYGLLALLTGAQLSGLQLSMYLYSFAALLATLFLYKHIRLQTPFQCLLLAHIYALDSVVNALYTAFFGVAWFYVLAQHPDDNTAAPGAGGISSNAGFTSPIYNVSKVDIVAEPAAGLNAGQNAVAVGQGNGSAGLGNAVFQSGSIMSITLISSFWALRVYFVFIMLAFARQCLRQHIASNASNAWYNSNTQLVPHQNLAENPFEEGKQDGYGWVGKLGRLMLSGAPQYWLGADEDGEWMRGVGGKFNRKTDQPQGPVERERRRRAGTGPPAPPRELRTPQLADLQEVRAS
ncbi:Inositolphosphorylceramide synthase subunit Kei1-domain-containing protein [Clohesyomyces aquaticus]|uniref:Inositolphosphorylceramide synthase subunit Kei1-domain-containing protein n=1 Tax=Clohesyomyces aquaticus TaxID=1231657 RepID=A0A1Y2A2H5_9PLEO|nr:Inositolphosphorylceramide synthase subunit Kei1-domain-containing protein [Clohesyomyces aquaticus]